MTRWTAAGPDRQAIVQPAFVAPAVELVIATVELGLTLFAWLSGQNSSDRKAAIAFSARQYAPGAEPSLALDFVGMLSRDEVDAACPRLGEVQWRTDEAAYDARQRTPIDASAAVYGTAVHTALKRQISNLDDPDFLAEVSLLKTLEETGEEPSTSHRQSEYGVPGSVRIDVLENVGNGTVCVYDIKTGARKLSAPRSVEIAAVVFRRYRAINIIVTEIRPMP